MKPILFLSVMFFSFSVSGQNSQKGNSHKNLHRIQIGANFLAEYSNRTLKNSTDSNYHDYIIQERNGDEYGKFGFSGGLNICIGISKLLSVETGIQYANRGYRTKPQSSGMFHNIATPRPILENTQFNYSYRYLDIPLKLNFIYGEGKIRFMGSLGLTANILMNEKATLLEFYDDASIKVINTISRNNNMTKIGFTPMIAAGFDYAFSKKMNIRMQSTYRRSITPLSKSSVHDYLYGVGVNVGYYYTVN